MTSNKFLFNAFTETTFAENSKIAVQAAAVVIFLKIFLPVQLNNFPAIQGIVTLSSTR